MVRFCRNCGRALDDDDQFCRKCGRDTKDSIDYSTYYKSQDKKDKNVVLEKDVPKEYIQKEDGQPQEVEDKMNLLFKEGGKGSTRKGKATFLYEVSKLQEGEVKDKDKKDNNGQKDGKEKDRKENDGKEKKDDGKEKKDDGKEKKDDGKEKKDDSDIREIVDKILANSELRKITPELLYRMVKARKKDGWTYDKIQQTFHVSGWTTIHYLRDIVPDRSTILISEEFKKNAEKKAIEILDKDGFVDIISLSEICPKRHFDIIANKGQDKRLINITVGNPKELRNKTVSLRIIPEFTCAILYMTQDLDNYNIVELKKIIGRS